MFSHELVIRPARQVASQEYELRLSNEIAIVELYRSGFAVYSKVPVGLLEINNINCLRNKDFLNVKLRR